MLPCAEGASQFHDYIMPLFLNKCFRGQHPCGICAEIIYQISHGLNLNDTKPEHQLASLDKQTESSQGFFNTIGSKKKTVQYRSDSGNVKQFTPSRARKMGCNAPTPWTPSHAMKPFYIRTQLRLSPTHDLYPNLSHSQCICLPKTLPNS